MCKQCGFPVVPDERQREAQARGFCSQGCWDVYEAVKQLDIKYMAGL